MYCWDGGAAQNASSEKADGSPVTKVNHFYNGVVSDLVCVVYQAGFTEVKVPSGHADCEACGAPLEEGTG